MGADFQMMTCKAEKSLAEVKKAFEDRQFQDQSEHGTSYSGYFNMAAGLTFSEKSFNDRYDAEDWLSENAPKWGNAICVKLTDGTWVIGANCAS